MTENQRIPPKRFLEFAREDFKQNTERGLVNAYGNLKRSMHSQIDLLLNYLGLLDKGRFRKLDFPEKFDLIKKSGFMTPESFKGLNYSRNLLEHDYEMPIKEGFEFKLDLVELYIEHTDKIMSDAIKFSDKWKELLAKILEQDLPSYVRKEIILKNLFKGEGGLLDLSNYPEFFIKGNAFNGILVVGDKAPAEHVIAISDIAVSLQFSQFEVKGEIKKIPIRKIGVGATQLASEVKSLNNNIISFGGPDINSITAKIMGDDIKNYSELTEQHVLIKLYDLGNGNKALVIVGKNPSVIKEAGHVLANYREFNLEGQEMIFTVDIPSLDIDN